MVYTSDPTDRPTGVLVPHGAAAHLLLGIAHQPGVGADDVVIALANVACDRSVPELLAPLTVGAKVVIADRNTVADGHRLALLINESAATIMHAARLGTTARRNPCAW